ncbi:zf-PARP-domain-containing protein [Irpex lacteus]|nr:zf-PARP-domain-containing protein [Irpex lacteus]
MSDDEAPRKKSGYRLEYASSARAKCKGSKPCNGTPIPKGALRFGSLVDFRGSTSFSWRHWGCVTSKIISNMKKSFDEADKLDGFGELREEDQDKIRKAWDAGHVADADIPETARSREPDEDEHTDNRKKQDNKGKAVKRAKDDDKADEPQQKKARKMKVIVHVCCRMST